MSIDKHIYERDFYKDEIFILEIIEDDLAGIG